MVEDDDAPNDVLPAPIAAEKERLLPLAVSFANAAALPNAAAAEEEEDYDGPPAALVLCDLRLVGVSPPDGVFCVAASKHA